MTANSTNNILKESFNFDCSYQVQRNNALDELLYANLDTYEGNSGSMVVLAETKTVVGILVEGSADYVKQPGSSCYFLCLSIFCFFVREGSVRIPILFSLRPVHGSLHFPQF